MALSLGSLVDDHEFSKLVEANLVKTLKGGGIMRGVTSI